MPQRYSGFTELRLVVPTLFAQGFMMSHEECKVPCESVYHPEYFDWGLTFLEEETAALRSARIEEREHLEASWKLEDAMWKELRLQRKQVMTEREILDPEGLTQIYKRAYLNQGRKNLLLDREKSDYLRAWSREDDREQESKDQIDQRRAKEDADWENELKGQRLEDLKWSVAHPDREIEDANWSLQCKSRDASDVLREQIKERFELEDNEWLKIGEAYFAESMAISPRLEDWLSMPVGTHVFRLCIFNENEPDDLKAQWLADITSVASKQAWNRALTHQHPLRLRGSQKLGGRESQNADYEYEWKNPKSDLYVFGEQLWTVTAKEAHLNEDELKYEFMEAIDKERKRYEALKAKFESPGAAAERRRTQLPEDVRIFVWRRDEGKCVLCGSNEDLEFDHIIAFSKGGSNTERNIQLLCAKCNRKKSAKI